MSVSDGHGGPRITRRAALAPRRRRARAAGSLPALLAACGSSSGSSGSTGTADAGGSMTGTMVLLSYPGWYGPNEFADFTKLHPGLHVKSEVSGTTGAAATARPDLEQRRCLRPLARRGAERRAAVAGQAAGTARHREGPERQAGSARLSHVVPVGDPDRLRQDRLRLPQGPDLRATDVLEGAVRARAQVLGQDHDAQVRHRHPGVVPEGTRLLGQHEGAEPAAGDAEAAARLQTAPAGDPRDRLLEGADRGHGLDRDRLRLRHRRRSGQEQEHRLGAADRGDGGVRRGLVRVQVLQAPGRASGT